MSDRVVTGNCLDRCYGTVRLCECGGHGDCCYLLLTSPSPMEVLRTKADRVVWFPLANLRNLAFSARVRRMMRISLRRLSAGSGFRPAFLRPFLEAGLAVLEALESSFLRGDPCTREMMSERWSSFLLAMVCGFCFPSGCNQLMRWRVQVLCKASVLCFVYT